MSLDAEKEVYKVHLDSQRKYTYFLLAAAGAAIGFAIKQTENATLNWYQIPLGLSVIFWCTSFLCGCRNLQYVTSTLFANFELLKVEGGRHSKVGNHPDLMMVASEGIRSAIDKNSVRAGLFYRAQFTFLIIGCACFIIWHILQMYLRTRGAR
jgi:hypothetical protein